MECLKYFFQPSSVAVVGVSREPNKIGHVIYRKLKRNQLKGLLKAKVYPVNPNLSKIDGEPVYGSLLELDKLVDLAVVAVPAIAVPEVIRDAVKSGVKAAVIVSGGFSETGNDELENSLKKVIHDSRLRVMGPNTVGVLDLHSGVDTFFIDEFRTTSKGEKVRNLIYPKSGNISIVSQSGALATYFVDSLGGRGGGLRAAACVGNQIDVTVEELVSFFADDEHTRVLAVYVEGIKDGRTLLNQVLKARKRGKTVVVLKAGKAKATEKAAYTHTASMVGEWQVYAGALRQAGAVVVESITDFIDVAYAASFQKIPKGRNLLIVTNAGGFSVLSSDLAYTYGLEVPPLPQHAFEKLIEMRKMGEIPSIVVPNNPLDLSGSASPDAFEKAYEAVSDFGDIHILIPLHSTPAIDETVIEKIAKTVKKSDRTVLGCDVGFAECASLFRRLFSEKGIPVFADLESAVRTASLLAKTFIPSREMFPSFKPLEDGERKPLSRALLVSLLREHGINIVREKIVYNEDAVAEAVDEIGFPVVMKLASEKIPHKSDVGGVVLNVSSMQEALNVFRKLSNLAVRLGVSDGGVVIQQVVHGIELILGSKVDPIFGPVVTVGIGGFFAEALKDYVALAAPVEKEEVKAMLQYLRFAKLLEGFRNIPPADLEVIAETVTNFSQVITETPDVVEVEINPLIVNHKKAVAVDFRALLKPTS